MSLLTRRSVRWFSSPRRCVPSWALRPWVSSPGRLHRPFSISTPYESTSTPAFSGLTTKREGERVLGAERPRDSPVRVSLVDGSRGRRKRGPWPGTTGVVSRETRAPTAFAATGAPQNARPEDSGLMMAGSPRDRDVRTPEPRRVEPPSAGPIVAFPDFGGLHHRYSRAA